MITERMRSFLRKRLPDGPCLVIDLDVVREKYREFERAMPETRIFYAVKANPAPEILSLLANLGSSFDAASVAEIEMALLAGATGERDIVRQHDQEEKRYFARLSARCFTFHRRQRGGGRENSSGGSASACILSNSRRRSWCGVAAVAQVRLFAGDGYRGTALRQGSRTHSLRRRLSMSARNKRL